MIKYEFEVWQKLPTHPYPRRIEYVSFAAASFNEALDLASKYAILEHGWNNSLWLADKSTGLPYLIDSERYQCICEEELEFVLPVEDEEGRLQWNA